jgi:hypothetical protein
MNKATLIFFAFIRAQVAKSFTPKTRRLPAPKSRTMKNISYFFPVAKLFGLAPYSLEVQSDQKPNRFASLISRILTFLMIVFYATFVCSIFWKSETASEISNTANWIQVRIQ